uniref:Uncharacterized protein n=1 Tax=Syphacia muris TaxID=451379 RepID=A0A0N5AJQ4_9BILA
MERIHLEHLNQMWRVNDKEAHSADTYPLTRLDRYINAVFNLPENTPSSLLAICGFALVVIVILLCFYCSHRLGLPVKPEQQLTLRTVSTQNLTPNQSKPQKLSPTHRTYSLESNIQEHEKTPNVTKNVGINASDSVESDFQIISLKTRADNNSKKETKNLSNECDTWSETSLIGSNASRDSVKQSLKCVHGAGAFELPPPSSLMMNGKDRIYRVFQSRRSVQLPPVTLNPTPQRLSVAL